jgi:hypothetical protein
MVPTGGTLPSEDKTDYSDVTIHLALQPTADKNNIKRSWQWLFFANQYLDTTSSGSPTTQKQKKVCTDTEAGGSGCWGASFAVLNEENLNNSSTFFVEYSITAIYALIMVTVAKTLKDFWYKSFKDALITDMETTNYIWAKINGIHMARVFATMYPEAFLLEERLWWQLHALFKDPAKLSRFSSKPQTTNVRVALATRRLESTSSAGRGAPLRGMFSALNGSSRRDRSPRMQPDPYAQRVEVELPSMSEVTELKKTALSLLKICGTDGELDNLGDLYDLFSGYDQLTGRTKRRVDRKTLTLWEAGVVNNDVLCLCKRVP